MASNVSDFIIETTNEAYESLASVKNCDKNPGHEHFYSLNNLTVDILPEECRTEQWLKFILDFSKRVVRIIINKPDGSQLFGTGCVFMWDDDDSDLDSDKFYIIVTNEHVIGSQEDVRNCKVEWFYNTEDRAGIETSCGVELVKCNKKLDWCEFSVTNIPETVKQLLLQPPDIPPDTNLEHIIAISHPHGAPKTVTFGKCLGGEYVDGVRRDIHTARTCGGSSGTNLIYTRHVYSLYDWQYGWYFTHYAGRRANVYKLKKHDGTYREVTSETNNINYST